MRLVKAVLAGLLVLALGVMWTNRQWLVDAYEVDEPTASIRLSGVDLAVEPTPVGSTPYRLPVAPDTRAAIQTAGFDDGPALALPTPSLAGGEAELTGTVTGPDGPVQGAWVRVERHTDHGSISADIITDEEGRWDLEPVAGGRYRVRAWVPELMTTGRSEVRFVADDEVAAFDLEVWGVDPAPAFEFVDGGPMYAGIEATVALFLGWRSVDVDGLVVTNPVVGAGVALAVTPQVQLLSPPQVATGSDGSVRVRLRCVPTTVPSVGGITSTPVPGVVAAPAGVSAEPGPGGSLTASSDSIQATFSLPGCLPNPGLVTEPGPPDTPAPPDDSIDLDTPTTEPVDSVTTGDRAAGTATGDRTAGSATQAGSGDARTTDGTPGSSATAGFDPTSGAGDG